MSQSMLLLVITIFAISGSPVFAEEYMLFILESGKIKALYLEKVDLKITLGVHVESASIGKKDENFSVLTTSENGDWVEIPDGENPKDEKTGSIVEQCKEMIIAKLQEANLKPAK